MLLIAVWAAAPGASSQVVFGDERADTAAINSMLIAEYAAHPASPGLAVADFAMNFVGAPYKVGTLEGEPETLRVDISGFDCTTLAETALAMALTVEQGRTSWRDFVYNLRNIRYRNGETNGYASRMHYVSDWAVNNTYRGNFTDVTNLFPKYAFVVKTLNFMSHNADKYPALADSANLAAIRDVEIGFRRHRFPYIKSNDVASKEVKDEFRTGDIVAFTTNVPGLDVAHMGVIVVRDGEPYLLHASSTEGKVVLSDVPLDRYLKRNRSFSGVRVFRLTGH